MRGFSAIGLSVLCLCAHAAEPPRAATPTVAPTVAPTVTHGATPATVALRSANAAQLQTEEVAVLLEHLQGQHVYLKHLENMRRAVEKELSIVRLMRECDRFGSACTGRGIVGKPRSEEPPQAPASQAEESPQPGLFAPALPAPPLPSPGPLPGPSRWTDELPVVAGVYRDTASLVYQGRRIEVRAGAKVGPFKVTAVTLDGVGLDGPDGAVTLPAQWQPQAVLPHLVDGDFEF